MTKAELVNAIAIKTGYDKTTIMNVVESAMANIKSTVAEGETVYIVHQQDKSTKAQPVDFYGTANRPILMVGEPTKGNIDVSRLSRNHDDTAFRYRKIVGEEIGSLTGAFRQGLRENIIVFSDEYFEVAKDLWEITDINSGILMNSQYYEMFYKDFGVAKQGPTTLVLFEDIPDEKMEIVEKYGKEKLYEVAKINFMNTSRILKTNIM